MPDKETNNTDLSRSRDDTNVPDSARKKPSRALLVLFLIFAAFVTTVFLAQREDKIDWIEDYEAGLKLAKQQNKPVLIAFYKKFTQYCSNMEQDTLKDPRVIDFIESNFIPILIDVDKQPKIAEQYNVGYYPTHYIKYPNSNDIVGPHIGYDVPSVFIRKIEVLLEKLDLPNK